MSDAPFAERYQSNFDKRWLEIRDLRNRVFHHERILHWKDLDDRHQATLEIIAWMSPELHHLARNFDRFLLIRKNGPGPWIEMLKKYRTH
ncbi:MAG: hypothetical protein ACKOHM_02080 [Spartobacteria bacterium]